MSNISGKVIIVTGAGRGIGAATAKILSKSGARVVLASLSSDDLKSVAHEIINAGGECIYQRCDVRENNDVKEVMEATLQKYGTVDGLVNNAGTIQPLANILDADANLWKKCIETHLMGSLHFVKAVLPVMLENDGGTIINISSGAAELPLVGWGAYNTAKSSLRMLSQVLYKEVQGSGIRVFSMRPGAVDTEMQEEIRIANVNDTPAGNIPKEKLTSPNYPASAIKYLFSEDADDLAGKELDVRHKPLAGRFQ
jgi:NAD(P)-dependent dehydrogenase (short-subunit alcohol dehydrogenase family)